MAFGFIAVFAYHKSLQSKLFYALALVALLFSLLSAEAGVVVACYLGAYLFIMDDRPWLRRILHLLPFAVLVILWRLFYQAQGYGVSGVDFYLDPSSNPLEFIQLASIKLWSYFFELWSGFDVFSGQIRVDFRQQLAVVGVLIFSALMFVIHSTRSDINILSKSAKFFLLASVFALVPGLAVVLSPRVMLFPFVGFAVVLAELMLLPIATMQNLSKAKQWLLVSLNVYTLTVHLLLSFILAVVVLLNTVWASNNKASAVDALDNASSIENMHLVFIASPQTFNLMFLAYELDYKQMSLPLSIRQLSNNWFDLTVERISETEFILLSSPAFQFDNETLLVPVVIDDFKGGRK